MDSEAFTPKSHWTLDASDRALVEAMQVGQVEALQELYRRYGRLVYTLALRILGTVTEAEDLTQEIFLKLWQQQTYDFERGSIGTFLTILARSRAIDRVRSRKAYQRLLQRWKSVDRDRTENNLPLERATLGERAQHVQSALTQLSEREREILEIAYYEGLSQSEIAHRLDVPLGTVKTRSRTALKKLRTLLKDLI
jgi:RNA polymerase sigma-70 factor (ECF subfamily)